MNEEHSVLKRLPDNGEKCFCFGHKTYCCVEDMEEMPDWHEVIFKIVISECKIKSKIPEDPEESIFEYAKIKEIWDISDCEHVIGVTKWRYLQ